MGKIEITLHSDLSNEPPEQYTTEQGVAFIGLDEIIGNLVVAYSISNFDGAAVYLINQYQGNIKTVTREEMKRLTVPGNLYAEVLPWHKTKLPFHLDTGELGELTIQHRPTVIIEEYSPEWENY